MSIREMAGLTDEMDYLDTDDHTREDFTSWLEQKGPLDEVGNPHHAHNCPLQHWLRDRLGRSDVAVYPNEIFVGRDCTTAPDWMFDFQDKAMAAHSGTITAFEALAALGEVR